VRRLALASVLWLAVVTPAHAQDENYGGGPATEFGENAPRNYESSQHFAFEIKLGPYSPNIDASPGLNKLGGHPFADLFSPGKSRPPGRLLTQLEFDYQFWHKWYGNFAIGHDIGYYRRTAHSLEYNSGDPTSPCDPTKGQTCVGSTGDTTALNIIPLELTLNYRFDYLAKRYHIPFVPYVKVGLAYYVWWIENGNGFLSIAKFLNSDGKVTDTGFGGTFGWVLNPGGTFLLDVLDPTAAHTLDSELGINHTYLFCELHYANITGFGASNKMNLSDVSLNAGLGFDF
jgi:hypothetical protein